MDNICEAERTLKRLLPLLEQAFSSQIAADQHAWLNFLHRLDAYFPKLFELYLKLYSQRYELFSTSRTCCTAWLRRPSNSQLICTNWKVVIT